MKMGYRKMTRRDLWDVYRRWCAGQSVSYIARNEKRDRKTVREYIEGLQQLGLRAGEEPIEEQEFYRLSSALLPARTERSAPARVELARYREEIRRMITRKEEPLVAKYAFLVVKQRYDLKMSYETFKRFARQEGLSQAERPRMIRIELPAGVETQLDYGKVGTLADPVSGRNRVVWAFCAVLSHSRLPFVEFVYTQDQVSFVGSFVAMVEYYQGVTEFISIDNLKAGVVKPDLWDPQINRALAEAAQHYGSFIDPCRVGRATDKAKVERMVPTMRQLFRMLKELHPGAGLAELNGHALLWCRNDYGRREHGTTGVAPAEAFEAERGSLKSLPGERFEVPVWKHLTVHSGDQFVTFGTMRFSLPAKWRGQKVWARYAAPFLSLYSDEMLIRRYVVKTDQRRYWVAEDFPGGLAEMMNGGYPAWILEQSRRYGEQARALIASVLQPQAYLNARRARGMLPLMEQYHSRPYFDEVCRRAQHHGVRVPATLRRMLESAENRGLFTGSLSISQLGSEMVRDIGYYLN